MCIKLMLRLQETLRMGEATKPPAVKYLLSEVAADCKPEKIARNHAEIGRSKDWNRGHRPLAHQHACWNVDDLLGDGNSDARGEQQHHHGHRAKVAKKLPEGAEIIHGSPRPQDSRDRAPQCIVGLDSFGTDRGGNGFGDMLHLPKRDAPRRVLLAPDAFKGTLESAGVVRALGAACQSLWPECTIDCCPIADGGEGTLAALEEAWRLDRRELGLAGPMGTQSISSAWGQGGPEGVRGVVEAAEVVGLHLTPEARRDPERASSHGLGELLQHAVNAGVRDLVVGLGGTGTVDGGAGAAAAMGAEFLDDSGAPIPSPICGGDLKRVAAVQVPAAAAARWEAITLRLARDVDNPLLGPRGAAAVFGPQKGASPEAVERLEAGLARLGEVLGIEADRPGFGAAGGIPLALVTLFGASLERGIEVVLEAVDFDPRCREADLVFTGEGSLDAQSRMGKAAVSIAERAQSVGVETIAVVGRRSDDFGSDAPFSQVISLVDSVGPERAMEETERAITESVVASLG